MHAVINEIREEHLCLQPSELPCVTVALFGKLPQGKLHLTGQATSS